MSLLLTSVFRPFGVDDEYGRKENKLELFHNQVTREQEIFSIRYNHKSFGLYFIAENIKMPTVILDFPSLKQFRKELRKGYDYVGISFITPNFIKAKKMAEIAREVSPTTKIILGGHGTRIPDIEELIDADYYFRGEGIHQLRKLFGEDVDAPISHPVINAADHKRVLGLPIPQNSGLLIPGVGCPNACRFCCTSDFYDHTYYPFMKTGQELFDTMCRISDELGTEEFFVMDENFLLHKDRAMELLDLMEEHDRPFTFSLFSSAEAITAFGIDNMVRLGVGYIWVGVESKKMLFEKTKGIDVPKLISDLRANGILVLASNILFLEHHDKETIWEDIDFAISLKPDFTQFMQLGPLPQTKLYKDYKANGILREDIPYEEWHGQHRIWFDHPNFTQEETQVIIKEAFQKEYNVLGPSVVRWADTMINGFEALDGKTEDEFMLKRLEQKRKRCEAAYYILAALKWLAPTKHMKELTMDVIQRYKSHFGSRAVTNWIASSFVFTAASIARFKLKLGYEAHNPKAYKTRFRLEPAVYKEMKGRIEALLRNRKTWAFLENQGGTYELSLHFSGTLKKKTARKLIKRLKDRPQFSLRAVKINITPLADVNNETFEKFLEKLSSQCQDIRIYCSETQKRQIEKLDRFVNKRLCKVSTI